MVSLIAMAAFVPVAGPIFDVANATGRPLVVAAKGFPPVRIAASNIAHLTPFRNIVPSAHYALVLKSPDGRVYATLKFDGEKLLASRRPIVVAANPHDVVVRLGSRRFRMIYVPEKK